MRKKLFAYLSILTCFFIALSFSSVKAEETSSSNGLTIVENLTNSPALSGVLEFDETVIPDFTHGCFSYSGYSNVQLCDVFSLTIYDTDAEKKTYLVGVPKLPTEFKNYSYDQIYSLDLFVQSGKWGYYSYVDSTSGTSSLGLTDVYGAIIPQSIGYVSDRKYINNVACYVYKYYLVSYYYVAKCNIIKYEYGEHLCYLPCTYIENIRYSSSLNDNNVCLYCVNSNCFSEFKGSINNIPVSLRLDGVISLDKSGVIQNVYGYVNLVDDLGNKVLYDYMVSVSYSYTSTGFWGKKTVTGVAKKDELLYRRTYSGLTFIKYSWVDSIAHGSFDVGNKNYDTRIFITTETKGYTEGSVLYSDVDFSFDNVIFKAGTPPYTDNTPRNKSVADIIKSSLKTVLIIVCSLFGLFLIYKFISLFQKNKKR